MRRRLVLVLILACTIGLVASALVYRVLVQVASHQEVTEPVVVAAVNMSMADTITAQHVNVVAFPKRLVPSGAVRSLKDAEGRVVRSSIVAGEPLLEAKLAPALSGRGGLMPMLVPEGERGVTIKVDDAIKESGFVLPNSRVDVVVSMSKEPGSQERISKLILQDVLVLAAGQTVELRDNKPVTVSTVTLALAPAPAERLALAQNEGRLTLAMPNLRYQKVVATTGATARTILADGVAPVAVARPVKGAKARTIALAPPKVETFPVEVVRGTKVAEQVFVREGQDWVEHRGK